MAHLENPDKRQLYEAITFRIQMMEALEDSNKRDPELRRMWCEMLGHGPKGLHNECLVRFKLVAFFGYCIKKAFCIIVSDPSVDSAIRYNEAPEKVGVEVGRFFESIHNQRKNGTQGVLNGIDFRGEKGEQL